MGWPAPIPPIYRPCSTRWPDDRAGSNRRWTTSTTVSVAAPCASAEACHQAPHPGNSAILFRLAPPKVCGRRASAVRLAERLDIVKAGLDRVIAVIDLHVARDAVVE